MTPERFAELVAAYGAEPRRWPLAQRQAAMAFIQNNPDEAEIVLNAARKLDGALDLYLTPTPGAGLTGKIIESAPAFRVVTRRIRIWKQGARLAALGLVGALAGALAIAVLLPVSTPGDEDNGAYAMTAFSDMAQMTDQ